MTNRRSFLGVAAALPCAFFRAARAQQAKVYRIGYLHPTDPSDAVYLAFVQALKDLGYVIGANTILETRFAENKIDRLPAMAADLVAKRVDIIVAVAPSAIRAARSATQTIPIVMSISGGDPVKSGFAASLRGRVAIRPAWRPGSSIPRRARSSSCVSSSPT